MENNDKTQNTLIKDHHKFFYDEVTKRKIERHLSDINDTISDEDIMNVITDISSSDLSNTNRINIDTSSDKRIFLNADETK
ncbi:MAG: hypothetical protein ABI419_10425 [Ginsengibacter sp.]